MGFLSKLFRAAADRDLLAELVEDYRAEAAQAAHLRHHAALARYPQVATQLRALADVEERHAGWLRDHILGLGGGISPGAPPPPARPQPSERAVVARQAAPEKRPPPIQHPRDSGFPP